MRYILIILSILILSSCNPFITKELRRKNKCNRKLERVVKKCPELLKTDTITIIIPEIKIDTIVEVNIDTLVIGQIINGLDTIIEYEQRVSYLTKYITTATSLDTNIYQDGVLVHLNLFDGNLHVSIKKDPEPIKVAVDIVKPVELTPLEKVMNAIGPFFWWIVIVFVLFVLYRHFIHRLIFPKK